MSTLVPVKDGIKVMRVRFYVNIENCKGDWRSVLWPIPHPYWCSSATDTHFVLVAYVENEEQLMAQWPDAENPAVKDIDQDHYIFTDRFAKPDWME